jgi:hypothetical protein
MLGRFLLILIIFGWSTTLWAAVDLSGSWEVQTMGSDREIKIEQRGAKIVAHRILWPEFEGKKYRLEHLYRGTMTGNSVTGQLLVKDEDASDFDVLRNFSASVTSADVLVFDDLPVKRVGQAPVDRGAAPAAPAKPAAQPKRPSQPQAVAQTTPPPSPPPPSAAPAPASPAPGAPAEDQSASLYSNIMGASPGAENLFKVSAQVQIPDEAADLTAEGDKLLANGEVRAALQKFEQASKVGTGPHVELLQRMGKCYLQLHDYAQARAVLKRAVKLDPNNAALRKDYEAAKRVRS